MQMEPNKVYTLTTRRPLTKSERQSRIRSVVGIALGMALFSLGFLIGANATGAEPTPEPEPSKEEIPAAEILSVFDTVELTQDRQAATPVWNVPLAEEELAAVLESCENGHIAPELAFGLIQVESSFRADVVNPESGCYGYCQLNPSFFPSGLSPADNIRTGIGYLAEQLVRYDNLEAALTAYNAGYDTGDRTYADKVLDAASAFERNVG